MPSPEAHASSVAELITAMGGASVVTALVTWLLGRGKAAAEADKLTAEAGKLEADSAEIEARVVTAMAAVADKRIEVALKSYEAALAAMEALVARHENTIRHHEEEAVRLRTEITDLWRYIENLRNALRATGAEVPAAPKF